MRTRWSGRAYVHAMERASLCAREGAGGLMCTRRSGRAGGGGASSRVLAE